MIAQLQNCLFKNLLNNIVTIGYQVANAKAMNNYRQTAQ